MDHRFNMFQCNTLVTLWDFATSTATAPGQCSPFGFQQQPEVATLFSCFGQDLAGCTTKTMVDPVHGRWDLWKMTFFLKIYVNGCCWLIGCWWYTVPFSIFLCKQLTALRISYKDSRCWMFDTSLITEMFCPYHIIIIFTCTKPTIAKIHKNPHLSESWLFSHISLMN